MVKLKINGEYVPFETTMFPDKTSQVWKVDAGIWDYEEYEDPTILWLFENEGEIMQVLQLAELVQKMTGCETVTLEAPYLPYGRQDKEVDNKKSFALHTFTKTLYNANICRVETFDAHSTADTSATYIASTSPTKFHDAIFKHDVVCFPDKGAADRYGRGFGLVPILFCEKVRNQLTGEITGLKVNNPSGVDISGLNVLIVDDICDGGMTFIKVAEALRAAKPAKIDLAVSHGIFSKGKRCLFDAGINQIFTTNSLLSNPEGFKVW